MVPLPNCSKLETHSSQIALAHCTNFTKLIVETENKNENYEGTKINDVHFKIALVQNKSTLVILTSFANIVKTKNHSPIACEPRSGQRFLGRWVGMWCKHHIAVFVCHIVEPVIRAPVPRPEIHILFLVEQMRTEVGNCRQALNRSNFTCYPQTNASHICAFNTVKSPEVMSPVNFRAT